MLSIPWKSIFCLLIALAITLALAPALPAGAAEDAASFFSELESINGSSGSIELTADISLSEALPPITGAITIEGNGHSISGDRSFRIFEVAGGELTLRNLTLAGGYSAEEDGGAILAHSGARLEIENGTFRDNEAGKGGGAIATDSSDVRLFIEGSSFISNHAGAGGGAVIVIGGSASIESSAFLDNSAAHHGGALETLNGRVEVKNSTFQGNQSNEGAAILVSGAKTTMTHLTIVDNQGYNGDGIYRRDGSAILRNSIVAGSDDSLDCVGGLHESSGNFSQDGSCAVVAGGDPLLAAASGRPAYFEPLDGSPAVDAAESAFCLDTDQNGMERPLGGGCDIGAIESATASPAEPTPVPVVCALAEKILAANSNRAVGACPAGSSHDIISIEEDITLSEPLPQLNSTITIEGNGHSISGDDRFTIFTVAGGKLTIKDLTLTDGYSETNGGAILLQGDAQLELENVTFAENNARHGGAISVVGFYGSAIVRGSVFTGNRAGTGGGAILWNGGTLTVENSAFSANEAEAWGGAIETLNGRANIANSTFSSNVASSGGAIFASGATTTMTHLTLVDNRAWFEGNAVHKRDGVANLLNSVIASASAALDCSGGLDQSSGNISDDGSCALFPSRDPRLAAASGTPAYFEPLNGSPAVDAADSAFCLESDQNGTPRPQGGGCDAGAIESTSASPPPAAAAALTECTLANHILSANSNTSVGGCPAGGSHDIISLSEDIKLDAPLPAINGTITIEGNGHTISGDDLYRIFTVIGRTLTINNLTLERAMAVGSGGAVLVRGNANLVVNNSTFKNNRIVGEESGDRIYGGSGGAIATQRFSGAITINNSVFNGNNAYIGGGALSITGGSVEVRGSAFIGNRAGGFGGAFDITQSRASVENSTLNRNQAASGGAIYISSGTTTLTHLTMLDNRATQNPGDAVYVWEGSARLRNSIVAGGGSQPDCEGNVDVSRGNFSEDGTCAAAAGDDALLGDLTVEDGAPGYFPPLEGSPAVDAADRQFCVPTDQNGAPRPHGGGCDIGAIELGSVAPAPQALSAASAAAAGAGGAVCSVTTTAGLNFRDAPNGNRIGLIPLGTTVPAIGGRDRWFNVEYDGRSGWVSGDYLRIEGVCAWAAAVMS